VTDDRGCSQGVRRERPAAGHHNPWRRGRSALFLRFRRRPPV